MDDDSDRHLEADADSFGEWIEQVAEYRGVSEDDLLHQLMSSYWMMDELATVIDDLDIEPRRGANELGTDTEATQGGGEPAEPFDWGQSGRPDEPMQSAPSSDRLDDGVIALIETLKDWESHQGQPESSTVDKNLIDLIKVIQEGNRAVTEGQERSEVETNQPLDGEADGVTDTVQLIRALKEFNEPSGSSKGQDQLQTESRLRKLDDRIDELDAELEGVTRELDAVDESTHDRTAELADQLEHVSDRLEALEDAVQSSPDARSIEKLEEAVGDLADQITSVQSQVDGQFDEVEDEFENVERILTHLFDEVDGTTEDTEALKNQVSNLQSRLAVLDDLEAAGELKRKANRAGVSVPSCGACGESVDVAQLTEPECPFCNTEFDGLASDKKWGIFSRHTLTPAEGDGGQGPE